jgi:hypothetical protein
MKFRKIGAAITAAALVGMGVIGLASSASAHTGDLNATAVCNSDTGKYEVTYTLTISNTSLNGSTKWSVGSTTFAHTPTSNSDLPGTVQGTKTSSGSGTITLGTISVDGSSTKAPWAYAFTTWSDNFTKGSDGGDIALAGTCGDNDTTKKVDVCHATGSNSNPYTKINISVSAFFQAGHIDHAGDIYEAFDYVKHGTTHHVDAKGDTSLLKYDDCVKPVTKVVPSNPIVKDKCGTENDHYGLPDNTDSITYTRSGLDIVATITADDTTWGTLPAGWVKTDGTHATYPFSATNWDTTPCEVPPTHITVTFPEPTQPTCTEDGSLPNKPEDTDQVTWAWDGNTLTATAKPGFVIDGDASKTYDTPGKATGNQSTDPNAPCFVPPPPQECTPSGDWYTEDIAPTVTPDGWLFSGPHAQAVDYYHPVSGNLQGLAAQSITYTNVSGYHPSLVFEVYRNGTTGYATIVAEPYQNGWVAGQSGTFTVTQSTKVWTSKIASGPGSQSDPIALSDMAALYPLNALISEGIHLGTNSTADQYATVTSLDGCASVNTVPVQPEPTTVHDYDSDAVCTEPADGTVTVTYYQRDGERPYVWDEESRSYVPGDDDSITWHDWYVTDTESYADSECPPPPVPDTVTTETSQPVCGDTTVTTTTTTTSYHWEFQAEQSEREGAGTWVKVTDEPVVTTSSRPITNEEIDALDCPLVPGKIVAQCVGNIPYLTWNLDLPAGFTTNEKNPVTITFHKGTNTYTLPGTYPLDGKTLWPGANVNPAQWPGWTLDGTQPTNDPARFGWTRDNAQVTFEVNPGYTTTVAYPAATSTCANPPVPTTPTPTPTKPHTAPTAPNTTPPVVPAHLASTGAQTGFYAVLAGILALAGTALVAGAYRARRSAR